MRTLRIIAVISTIFVMAWGVGYAQTEDINGADGRADWGIDKVPDGSMDEWSDLGGAGGHGTVDNEYYFYDSGEDFWKDPQGFPDDEPLSELVIENHPVTGNPEPIASGFNLWGGYICYEPYHDDISIIVALDLPLSSNLGVSQDWQHPYNNLPPTNDTFYPVAFDCDGNGDTKTVNNGDYPGTSGFNFIKGNGLVFDDRDAENYIVTMYLGDDNFPSNKSFTPGGTDGLIIQVEIESEFGVISAPTINIPGVQTKSGVDEDLIAAYGADVLQVGGYNNPDPTGNPRIVDIEVKVNKLKTIIEDSAIIDWTKVGIGQISIHDLNKIFVSIKSGSLDDKSDEHLVQGGHVFPGINLEMNVEKWVSCFPNGPWVKNQWAFRGAWVYYRILIENTSFLDAENVYVTDTLEKLNQAYTQVEWVSGPQIDVNQSMENIGPLPAGDDVELIFRVFTNPNYSIKGNTEDIKNTVLVEGDGPDLDPDPDPQPEASDEDGPIPIDIVIGEVDVEKLVTVQDKNGDVYGPGHSVGLPKDVPFPVTIKWEVTFTNVSELPIIPTDAFGRDDLLENLPGLAAPPGGDIPPWKLGNAMGFMELNVPYDFKMTQVVQNQAELDLLDAADGQADQLVTNTAYFADSTGDPEYEYLHPKVCGVEIIKGQDTAQIGTFEQGEVPTLSEWGLLILTAVLGGLIVLRLRR
jgi:hypothetical protein